MTDIVIRRCVCGHLDRDHSANGKGRCAATKFVALKDGRIREGVCYCRRFSLAKDASK